MPTTSRSRFLGARASNAGDQFHELWALRQALELLMPDSGLSALSLEGVRANDNAEEDGNPRWDGVDCALYYGGKSIESALGVELVQLKYSSANPRKHWTVARFCNSSGKKVNNSVIRRLCTDYSHACTRIPANTSLKMRFISNQPVSSQLMTAFNFVNYEEEVETGAKERVASDAERLINASGLSRKEFQEFARLFDITECGIHSRFKLQRDAISALCKIANERPQVLLDQLQMRIRELMLPESREIISTKDVLLWFGVSDKRALFPCPSRIESPKDYVPRTTANETIDALASGERIALIHGAGGCGKTTLLYQIRSLIPEASAYVQFDCFGGGAYLDSDDKRHLPDRAFLQMANELAAVARLPLFLPSTNAQLHVRQFLSRLRDTAEVIKKVNSNAWVVVAIDAADNSVTAAERAKPVEPCFTNDLLAADLEVLPDNVKFIITCRTSRKAQVLSGRSMAEIKCRDFNSAEIKLLLEMRYGQVGERLADRFHNLTHGNPRVATYAIEESKGQKDQLLTPLLPGGKSLEELLDTMFKAAFKKLGDTGLFERIKAVLAMLPAPIDVKALSTIANCDDQIVRDFVRDLSPGLRISNETITIADEDFEDFLASSVNAQQSDFRRRVIEYFIETYKTEEYSSIHVADILLRLGEPSALLDVIREDPNIAAVGDIVIRRQTQAHRLRLSLSACEKSGSKVEAVQAVLLGAAAGYEDRVFMETIEEDLELGVEFAGSALGRSILLDPGRVAEQGPVLAHDAARAARSGDTATARERLEFFSAWMNARRNATDDERQMWSLTVEDVAATIEATLILDGREQALTNLRRWSPRGEVQALTAKLLVSKIIAAGRAGELSSALKNGLISQPWSLLIIVPLAMAGEKVDVALLEKCLRRLRPSRIPRVNPPSMSYTNSSWQIFVVKTYVLACELALLHGVESHVILSTVKNILATIKDPELRGISKGDAELFDLFLRCSTLKQVLESSEIASAETIILLEQWRNERHGGPNGLIKNKRNDQKDSKKEEIERKVKALFPVYKRRIEVLEKARNGEAVPKELILGMGQLASDAYNFAASPSSLYSIEAAGQAVMELIFVKSLNSSDLTLSATQLVGRNKSRSSNIVLEWVWNIRRLRYREANNLVAEVSKIATEANEAIESATSKVDTLKVLSKLLLPVSRPDSRAIFDCALEVAKEIDRDAFEQLHCVKELAKTREFRNLDRQQNLAGQIFAFANGAAERLKDYDGFPWSQSVQALAYVDPGVAFAACSKWSDRGLAPLEITLNPLLEAAVKSGSISPRTAVGLSMIVEGASEHLRNQIIESVNQDYSRDFEVVEEICKQAMTLNPQRTRGILSVQLDRQLGAEYQGKKWVDELRRLSAFWGNLHDDRNKLNSPPSRYIGLDDSKFKLDYKALIQTIIAGSKSVSSKDIDRTIEAADASGLRYDVATILRSIRGTYSAPSDKTQFLAALAKSDPEQSWSGVVLDFLSDSIEKWRGTPSVDLWCREVLPQVLVDRFSLACRYLGVGSSKIRNLLSHTQKDAPGKLNILIAGVAQAGTELQSRTLFALAREMINLISPEDANDVLVWYASHLSRRLSLGEINSCAIPRLENDIDLAIGRFLYAQFSDIDTRIRWKTAHALRCLARLKCKSIVLHTLQQYDRLNDSAFREQGAPYYFLAARMWVMITFWRIAGESPEIIADFKEEILRIALSKEFPHAAVREYAKQTLLELMRKDVMHLTQMELDALNRVNKPIKGIAESQDLQGFASHMTSQERRFKFDSLDTLPYWYQRAIGIFPLVSNEEFLSMAESWILDKWKGPPEANRWTKEPREERFGDMRYSLWSHRHGTLPIVERYGTYLEWHAMQCVVGELLNVSPVAIDEYSEGNSFSTWIMSYLPTYQQQWIADLRGPTPLEQPFWQEDARTDVGWIRGARLEEFVAAVLPSRDYCDDCVALDGSYSVTYSKRAVSVRVSSALVPRCTALALVRALQTIKDPMDYALPHEGDDFEIGERCFQLRGIISWSHIMTGIDENDPITYDIRPRQVVPGKSLSEYWGLIYKREDGGWWTETVCNERDVIEYHTWSDEREDREDYGFGHIRSEGWRLLVDSVRLSEFLKSENLDIICRAQIERSIRPVPGEPYRPDKRKVHDRIFLLRADGTIYDARKRIGTWAKIS